MRRALLLLGLCACEKVGPGIPLGGGVELADGPAPAWDWWKRQPPCAPPAQVRDRTEGGVREIGCTGGGALDGDFARIEPDRITVGTMRAAKRDGAWRVYDASGALLEVMAYRDDDRVYGAEVQDGAPLVAHLDRGCESAADLVRIAGKHGDGGGPCVRRYAFFPGVAQVGEYAPDAGCLDNVWVVDCARAARAPAPKTVMARGGWERAKGPARERLAMRYLEEAGVGVLDPGTRAIASPSGAVVVDGWRTVHHEGIAPTETRDHVRWTFTPDGDVSAKIMP